MFSLLLVNPPFPLSLLCASEVSNTPRSVIGKKGHMVYLGRTIKFPFPDDMTWFRNPSAVNIDVYLNRKVVVQMCHMCTTRNGYCSQHTWFISHKPSPNKPYEAVVVHHDCFAIFIQSCPLAPRVACERLWEVAIARRPWPFAADAAPFSPSGAYIICPEAVQRIASLHNMPQMANIPVELVERILSHSPEYTTFWGAVAALTMASYVVSNITVLDEQRVALNRVLSWERGGKIHVQDPAPTEEPPHTDFLRITYDADGVRKVERLSQWPNCEKRGQLNTSNKRLAWVIVNIHNDAFNHKDVTVTCKDGFLRFDSERVWSPGHLYHRTWDTPTPPESSSTWPFELKMWEHYDLPAFQTGHLVNLDSISGITFAYAADSLVAIYPHPKTSSEIKKKNPYQPTIPLTRPWSERKDHPYSYFFLPVTEEDKIMAFGVRDYRNADVIVVSFSLSSASSRFHYFPFLT